MFLENEISRIHADFVFDVYFLFALLGRRRNSGSFGVADGKIVWN
jgi:hypothetical protein